MPPNIARGYPKTRFKGTRKGQCTRGSGGGRRGQTLAEFLQEFVYDDHHRFHSYTVLFWCDAFGRSCRLDFNLKGSTHDREIYSNTAVGNNLEHFFTRYADGTFIESFMAESGFQGNGPVEALHKGNQAASFVGRGARKLDISKLRV